jgi:ribonuclease-3
MLFKLDPSMSEGDMTKKRAKIVSEHTLFETAVKIGLNEAMIIGKSEENSGGRMKPSIISDAFEALLGAIYLDGGLKARLNLSQTT